MAEILRPGEFARYRTQRSGVIVILWGDGTSHTIKSDEGMSTRRHDPRQREEYLAASVAEHKMGKRD